MTETLVNLPTFARLSQRVWRVLGLNPRKFTLQGMHSRTMIDAYETPITILRSCCGTHSFNYRDSGTNTYLLGGGPRKILIDCGEGRPEYLPLLRTSLASLGAQTIITDIILTHTHFDHWGGLEGILSTFPGPIRVHKYPWPASRPQDPANVHTIPPQFEILPLQDGQLFKLEGDYATTLKTLYTPGHCEDHCCFLLEEENALFTADCVLGQGTAVFDDLGKYIYGLKNLIRIGPGRLYPGHGPVIEDGLEKLKSYVQHREEREQQILLVLASNGAEHPWSVMDIVRVIYKDYPESLFIPAANGVRLHLKKLLEEERVELWPGVVPQQGESRLDHIQMNEGVVGRSQAETEKWVLNESTSAKI